MTIGGYCLSAKKLNILNIMNQLNNNLIILCAFLFSLVIFSCNRDEPATDHKLTNQKVHLRNVTYCDGQISDGIRISGSYTDTLTGECCIIFKFDPSLNACYAKIGPTCADTLDCALSNVIQASNPTSNYTPIIDNLVTFCGPFMEENEFVIYFRPCAQQNSSQYGCMVGMLPPTLNCK